MTTKPVTPDQMTSTSNQRNWIVFFSTILLTAAAVLGYLQVTVIDDESLIAMLTFTARVSLLIFLLIFVARPLRQLVANDTTRWLVSQRRYLGIAFAAVHTVHLALIAWRFSTIPGLEYPLPAALVGGTTYLLMYALLITSFDAPARALGSKNWRRLHKTGLYFIGFIFAQTQIPESIDQLTEPRRLIFIVLIAAAIVIRLTAYLAMRKKKRSAQAVNQ